jgi:hypothetical protein
LPIVLRRNAHKHRHLAMRRFRMSFALARLGCGDQFMMGPLLQICMYYLGIRVYKLSTWDSVKNSGRC